MSRVAVYENGNSKFLHAERGTNGNAANGSTSTTTTTTMPYLNGGDKVVTGKPPLKSRGDVNGSLNKTNSGSGGGKTNSKHQTITNGKSATPTNEPAKTISLKKKIFTKGRKRCILLCWHRS